MASKKVDVLAESQSLKDYWSERDLQIRIDRDIVNLVKPRQTTDKVRWIRNKPKVFYDTAVALVSSLPPRFRLPLTINYEPEEKEKMNKAERFILGVFRELDNRQLARGQTYWMRELAYWHLSGWYANFTAVVERNGKTEFISDHWDPLTVYPLWDGNELIKCVRSFETDITTAMMLIEGFKSKGLKVEMKEFPKDTPVEINNYWRVDNGEVRNALYFSGQRIKPLAVQKNMKKIPIHVGAIGIPERGSALWQRRFGEHIIAAARDNFDHINKMLDLMVTVVAETTYPNLISKTKSGLPVTKDGMKGYGEEIALRQGEELELLKHASSPKEVFDILGMLMKDEGQATFPDVVWGGLNVELSGFAISQLLAAIRYKISPYLITMQYVTGAIATDFLGQFREGNFKKVTLSTTNPKGQRKGEFFVEDFSPSDVPEVTHVDVVIPITSALDKTQQIIFARQALDTPQLLSRETLWDEILEVQDSEQEYARILQDQTLEMPEVKEIAMIEQLRERQRLYESQGRTAEAQAMKRLIMSLELKLGMRQAIPVAPNTPNPPPNVIPPEMMNNPDARRAALGEGPPSPSRSSQSSPLVGPDGQPLR